MSGASLAELMGAVLDKGRSFRFQAKGLSMTPFIKDGDIITITPYLGKRVSIGEIVAFIGPHNPSVSIHRIIGRRGAFYLVQGDNVPEADGLIPPRQILGYVDKVEREGRSVGLGLGPERRIIAYLNRRGWLIGLRYGAARLLRPIRGRIRGKCGRVFPDEEK